MDREDAFIYVGILVAAVGFVFIAVGLVQSQIIGFYFIVGLFLALVGFAIAVLGRRD